jgi:undecaprenyl-diphosphatase
MVEILKSALFGIVQGITEWLPISSTGHMILLNEFVTLDVTPEFWEMFKVVIQFGSILAVVLVFWNRLFPSDFKQKPVVKKEIISMWLKVVVGCVPAGLLVVFGLDEVCDALFQNYITVAIMLIVVGVLFILIENNNKNKKSKITDISQLTYKTAFIIGIFQLIAAVFPGTSRSGSTIVGALLLGVSRVTAAEFTFFLAVPTMLGASLLKLLKFGFAFTGFEFLLLAVGMLVAFVVSVFAITFLMGYIKKHDFKVFGWYRIVLGIVVLVYFACKSLFFA